MEGGESILDTIYEEDNIEELEDVETLDVEEGEFVEENHPQNDQAANGGGNANVANPESQNKLSKRRRNKKNKKKKRNNGPAPPVTDINRFVIETCRRLKEKKSYMIYTAIGCLGVSALSDLIKEELWIQPLETVALSIPHLGVQTAKSVLKKACCRAEDAIRAEYDERFNELNQRLAKLEGSTTSTPTSQSARTMPIGTPTNLNERFDRSRSIEVPTPTSSRMYSIRSVLSSECIVVGVAAVTQTLGEKVNGFRLKENETKLNVAMVTPGQEDEPIYKEVQGGMSSIGETVGSYIIWPSGLLEPI